MACGCHSSDGCPQALACFEASISGALKRSCPRLCSLQAPPVVCRRRPAWTASLHGASLSWRPSAAPPHPAGTTRNTHNMPYRLNNSHHDSALRVNRSLPGTAHDPLHVMCNTAHVRRPEHLQQSHSMQAWPRAKCSTASAALLPPWLCVLPEYISAMTAAVLAGCCAVLCWPGAVL